MVVSYLFQMQPKTSFTQDEVEKLTDRIQNAGTEVVNAKAGAVSFLCLIFLVRLYSSICILFSRNQDNIYK